MNQLKQSHNKSLQNVLNNIDPKFDKIEEEFL